MTFLAIIIALLLTQAWGSGRRVHRDGWYLRWRSKVASWRVGAQVKLALVVLLPVALVQIALNALAPVMFGFLWIAMAVVLLLYSFGRGDFHALMARYRDQCRSADFEGAYLSTLPELGWAASQNEPVSAREVHALVQRCFIYEGYQRWFAVLFYFVLLGPAGALAYRLLQLCRDDFEAPQTERWIFLADWIPARLLAAAFTLTGDFVRSRDTVLHGLSDASARISQLLYSVGTAALGDAPAEFPDDLAFGQAAAAQNKETGSLLSRSAAAWVAVLSVAVLL